MDAALEVIGGHLEPSLELLQFYRTKINGFESERATYLQKLADVEAQNSELHRLRWELRAREDEVGDARFTRYHRVEAAMSPNEIPQLWLFARSLQHVAAQHTSCADSRAAKGAQRFKTVLVR